MFCTICGAANPDAEDVRFCRACGAELASRVAAPMPALAAAPGVYAAPLPDGPTAQAVAANGSALVVQAAVSPYAGFWIRLVARFVDELIVGGTCLVVLGAVGFTIGFLNALGNGEAEVPDSLGAIAYLVAIPYWVVFPPLLGATPGKLLFGYHVVDEEGRHIGFRRSIGRYLAQILSGIVIGLGYLWIAFDSHKQGWHDQIADTYVVRKELVKR